MTDPGRLIDRIELEMALIPELTAEIQKAIALIDRQPSAVVSCKSCQYGVQDEHRWWRCKKYNATVNLRGNGFCSNGRKKINTAKARKETPDEAN